MSNIENMVLQFAKANKISKAKLAEFASQVQATPTATHIVADKSQRIRKAILAQKDTFVSSEIAAKLGVTTVDVNNNLFSLQRKGIVQPTGEKRVLSQRGKPATIWKLK